MNSTRCGEAESALTASGERIRRSLLLAKAPSVFGLCGRTF